MFRRLWEGAHVNAVRGIGMNSKSVIDRGLERALAKLKATGEIGHVHSKRCMREISRVLSPDEETIMEIRQSHFRNISPERIVATNKRLIIVRPSFVGHYFGFDLFHHTDISFVPYKQLISIVMSRGKFLSTIHMRIHGFTDVTAIRNEGEVEGVKTNLATKFTVFLEDIIETRDMDDAEEAHQRVVIEKHGEHSVEKSMNLEDAKAIMHQTDKKFVWLGVEPAIEVAATLNIPKEKIACLDMSDIAEMNAEELKEYGGCIFVCYDGTFSNHVVRYLKKEYDIDAYTLDSGILHAAKKVFEKFS